MRIRELRTGELKYMQEKSEMTYDKHSFPAVLEDSFVLEDDKGEPKAIFMAERVAEIFMLMDHEWETPAMRWEAIRVGSQEIRRRLEGQGYRAAYAYFDDGVPQGYINRLVRFCGAELQKRIVRFAGVR